MNKLRALQAFEEQDGAFAEGDEFEVNDERAFVLIRTGNAERVTPAPVSIATADDIPPGE